MHLYNISVENELPLQALRESIIDIINWGVGATLVLGISYIVIRVLRLSVEHAKSHVNKVNVQYINYVRNKVRLAHFGNSMVTLKAVDLLKLGLAERWVTRKEDIVRKDDGYYIKTIANYTYPIEFMDDIDSKLVPTLEFIKDNQDFMLPQFYTTINYSLETLSKLSTLMNEDDYRLEIGRVSDTLLNIKGYLEEMVSSLTKTVADRNKQVLDEYLKKHQLVTEELNRGIDVLRERK